MRLLVAGVLARVKTVLEPLIVPAGTSLSTIDCVPAAVFTKAVVASFVELSVVAAVGAVGVPVRAGETLRTVLPVPVEVVTPVPPFRTGSVPVTPGVILAEPLNVAEAVLARLV
jgi:hypothetical protein